MSEQQQSSSSQPSSPSQSSTPSSSSTSIPESSPVKVTTITFDEPEEEEDLLNDSKNSNNTRTNSHNQKNNNNASAVASEEEEETVELVVDELDAEEDDDEGEEETDDDDDDDTTDEDNDDDNDEDAPRRPPSLLRKNKRFVSSTTSSSSSSSVVVSYVPRACKTLLLHLFCLLIYLLPILLHHNGSRPVLDEPHITAPDNRDVNDPNTTYSTIFTNDYWGRPMNSTSSHKSWRPLSILSFRYLKGGILFPDYLMGHRFVNVLTHAAVAELVGILATRLVMVGTNNDDIYFNSQQQLGGSNEMDWIRWFTKAIFALHPTHVEVMNAANRPHLLAVLCSVLLSDPRLPFSVFVLALVAGYLVAETFLFQVFSASVTLVAISYIRTYHGPRQVRNRLGKSLVRQVWSVLAQNTMEVLVRVSLLLGSAVAYYIGRYSMDWLSIPDGLIRPAENPFYHMEGWERVRNYLYVISIHVAKAWDVDFVGFSHEYGHECIKPVENWRDPRLCIPAGIAALYASVLLYLLSKQRRQSVLSMPLLLFIVHLSWMVTLFPISGIVKVGTFIADRIVVASTVSTSMLLGAAATRWTTTTSSYLCPTTTQSQKTSSITNDKKDGGRRSTVTTNTITTHWNSRLLALLFVACFMWRRIHLRMTEWMDPKTLLESSFKTCPRFAKAHLEASKIYSGLYPEHFNLSKSRWHLSQVEQIDPNFCDVHQQYAHVAIQENEYLEFEVRLTKALTCPFTITGSLSLWNRYWKIALNEQSNPIQAVRAARERYNRYMKVLNQAIEREEEQNRGETTSKSSAKSPLVGWKREL